MRHTFGGSIVDRLDVTDRNSVAQTLEHIVIAALAKHRRVVEAVATRAYKYRIFVRFSVGYFDRVVASETFG